MIIVNILIYIVGLIISLRLKVNKPILYFFLLNVIVYGLSFVSSIMNNSIFNDLFINNPKLILFLLSYPMTLLDIIANLLLIIGLFRIYKKS